MDCSVCSTRPRALRRERGLTRGEVAGLLGVTANHCRRLAYGQINIPVRTLDTLAGFFHVSADYLLGRDGQNELGPV